MSYALSETSDVPSATPCYAASASDAASHRLPSVICKSPYMVGGSIPVGCGQCLPCRINRRRLWTWRMFYEAQLHQSNCFVTLTYDEDHLPPLRSVVPSDLTAWIKRLRAAVEPRRFRYFAVGEYGDESARPHYHAILFGLGQRDSEIIDHAWQGRGLTATFEANEFTFQYTAGYTVKKLTRRDDPRLNGRHPEFARMSNRPGIGAGAMRLLSDQLHSAAGLDDVARRGDVPTHLKIGRKTIPLGRYLRKKLREEIGMPDGWNAAAMEKFSAEEALKLQALWRSKGGGKGNSTLTQKQVLIDQWEGKIRSIEWRDRNLGKKEPKI